MKKVITYGTFDLLHYEHICLLKRAKALGDYLIVGVTADDYDKARGKINVRQTLMERIEEVRAAGIADEIIVEEYEGQKIDDIRRYGIDIFTVGSDWTGKFDYLKEYCKVVYLERTEGISSSELRATQGSLRLGLAGETSMLEKYYKESTFVNGIEVTCVCSKDRSLKRIFQEKNIQVTKDYEELLANTDAVYLASHPSMHVREIRQAFEAGIHVLCESPVALDARQCRELFSIADQKRLVLMDAIKTAYATAYNRMLLLLKSGRIGRIVSVDATCTSLREIHYKNAGRCHQSWNSICAWGPAAMLPIFQILGTNIHHVQLSSLFLDKEQKFDLFTKADFTYADAVASFKVGKGVKSEGELVVSGTRGYLYVPAPWWKTDFFEIRYEDQENNQKYFYQLEGEGIRYEMVAFIQSIRTGKDNAYIERSVSEKIAEIIEQFELSNVMEI